jgi:intron-binding protein aquarius
MAKLYSWRYGDLGDLPCVQLGQRGQAPTFYDTANAGFAHTFQFVDVPDFLGRGESTPTPFFYQNLGEAEYVVATYQYMRLIGYPADRISIITTYNGQKELIRDILKQRCAHPFYGQPARVTTVDKYQGQQNDYILLSLVRTNSVGHLRDVRRLVVALSRARLGLYIFGRLSLFKPCQELSQSFDLLLQKPTQLQLVLGEQWPYTLRQPTDSLEGVTSSENEAAVHELVTKDAITELGTIVQSMFSIATREEDKTLPAEEEESSAMDDN